ncbi:fasciculation and elongation protein zeta-2-like isoform X2 [Biomphalaria glabrata]|uniref:Fasciculation and elongation protein zeta-2-like isoform X2 n=2 Tax=Biomphalaria TaxID=6525 RepID=A0A2C9K1S3_BIOGL|nr:fasciculation and elongation protein zeta-2-like isoform X2 [Biomphalaria glabrata]
MRVHKMAELQFEAPLASFENEEWSDFNEFKTSNLDKNVNNKVSAKNERNEGDESANFGEIVSGSLEDLVNSFDERITKCFNNLEQEVETFAPVQIRSQEEIMNDCQMWWTITGNFGNILPIDWSKSYARNLQNKVLNLDEHSERQPLSLDLSDDEDLVQAFDMHSLIVSSLHPEEEDKILTAEEVISEIDDMMKEPSPEDYYNAMQDAPEDVAYTKIKQTLSTLSGYTEQELKSMPRVDLHELVVEYDTTTKILSEMLVTELALRDELEFDKELKNQFISLLLTIQKKRRECHSDRKKKKVKTNGSSSANTTPENGNFLTTAIPYYPCHGPPSSEQLQIYIKILQAINEDSATVPILLTDYILKVLCPT